MRMIACINPRDEEYDETLSALRFAELIKDVQIVRAVQPSIRLVVPPRVSIPAPLQKHHVAEMEEELARKRLEILSLRAQVDGLSNQLRRCKCQKTSRHVHFNEEIMYRSHSLSSIHHC